MSSTVFDSRISRGQAIAQVESNVRRLDEHEYRVRSQSGNGEYQVISTEIGWRCECPDFTFRNLEKCKHIIAVELSLEIRRRIENAKRIVPLDFQSCLSCGSEQVVRHGIRHNKSGDLQRFTCRDCGTRFSRNLGFEGMKAPPKAITGALQLYFSGESLRNVQKFLRLQGVNISHQTVHNWITKYVGLMNKYLDQITPQVSDTWRADEVYVKFRGNMKYLFAMMDDESRFWIAQQVADTKYTADVRPLFAKGKIVAGKSPSVLITDGGRHFVPPFKKEFQSNHGHGGAHIRDIRLGGEIHNNKMERMNGEVRDREKTMRGLKTMDTAILKGMQLYHNFIRPHEGLNGATPADRAGIVVEGTDKWLTIIQNASQAKETKKRDP
jgi:putative transposase